MRLGRRIHSPGNERTHYLRRGIFSGRTFFASGIFIRSFRRWGGGASSRENQEEESPSQAKENGVAQDIPKGGRDSSGGIRVEATAVNAYSSRRVEDQRPEKDQEEEVREQHGAREPQSKEQQDSKACFDPRQNDGCEVHETVWKYSVIMDDFRKCPRADDLVEGSEDENTAEAQPEPECKRPHENTLETGGPPQGVSRRFRCSFR